MQKEAGTIVDKYLDIKENQETLQIRTNQDGMDPQIWPVFVCNVIISLYVVIMFYAVEILASTCKY